MAKHLARIHGTEEDKVNCPFYFKIGACRHEDRCSRLHHKPAFSPTILLKHMYKNPPGVVSAAAGGSGGGGMMPSAALDNNTTGSTNARQTYEDFLDFFEDVFLELSKYGRLEGLHVVDNLGDHMIGHVYAKYYDEEEAADALEHLSSGRYYDGRLLQVEYSPVTDFREARCRDFDEGSCSRAGFCNFLHVKPVHAGLIRALEMEADEARRDDEDRRRASQRGDQHNKKRKHHHDKKERSSKHHSKREHRRSRSRSASPSSPSPPLPLLPPQQQHHSYPTPPTDGLPPSFQYPPAMDRGGGGGGGGNSSSGGYGPR
jgi:splicing factor U2AF 35 kDa subunit